MTDDLTKWKLASGLPDHQCSCSMTDLHHCPAKAANTLRRWLGEAVAEVERLSAALSGVPRTCPKCGASGKWDASITHCMCGGRL